MEELIVGKIIGLDEKTKELVINTLSYSKVLDQMFHRLTREAHEAHIKEMKFW